MIRDTFYRDIEQALARKLDPDAFERCAADLLRSIYPTLVPICGGSDAGMDGAVADGEGEPFPLVTTTASDVIGNLTRSLRSYVAKGFTRRKVLLATSQQLTPRRWQHLHDRAAQLRFTLIQIHSREAIAQLLYTSPRWCKELLGLTGEPPALSILPPANRPLIGETLVGREEDMEWLRETTGDRLVVGQPGIGKTFLLYAFAKANEGLFVVAGDLGGVAATLRQERPKHLIVDDAHLKAAQLTRLSHIRGQTGRQFDIVATCWPGDKEKVMAALGIGTSATRELQLLTRDEIVEVVKVVHPGFSTELTREIVNQAEGKPGLAVTLAQLCLKGDIREVALGDALRRSVVTTLEPLVGKDMTGVLAAFAVGGDSGMHMEVVARALGLSILALHTTVTRLAAAGVVVQVAPQFLSVRPPALRYSLVRDVFFQGATALQIRPLLDNAPSAEGAALTLIGARAVGGILPDELLDELMSNAQSRRVWRQYAWLGQQESKRLLAETPDLVVAVAQPALQWVPEIAIPLLLENAVDDQRPLRSNPDHAIRLIEDWLKEADPNTGASIHRRRALLLAASKWVSEGKDRVVAVRAACIALQPKFERHTSDPGAGKTFTISFGLRGLAELEEIRSLWPQVLELLSGIDIHDWRPVQDALENWAYPQRCAPGPLDEEAYKKIRSYAKQMILDITAIAQDRPGVLHWANGMASVVEFNLELPLDGEFQTIFAEIDVEDYETSARQHQVAIGRVAHNWAQWEPSTAASRIKLYQTEAEAVDGTGLWNLIPLCELIAAEAESPSSWVAALVEQDVDAGLVHPFLMASARSKEEGWDQHVDRCMDSQRLRGAAMSVLLQIESPPEAVLSKALDHAGEFVSLIETLCIRGQVAEDTVRALLRHEDAALAGKIAAAEWCADRKGAIPQSLAEDWREAILRFAADDHWLGEILASDGELAREWLERRIQTDTRTLWRYSRVVSKAVAPLNTSQRRQLLDIVPDTRDADDLVGSLVGGDMELYGELLNNARLEQLHLVPLRGRPENVSWVEKAKLALDAGYSEEEVASATHAGHYAFVGKLSNMWQGWIDSFDSLVSQEDSRLRRVGELGRQYAAKQRDVALQEERAEDVYGI